MKTGIKIREAKYYEDYKINIQFTDGTFKSFDYKPMVTSGHEEFSPYMDVTKFKKFRLISKNTGIAWGSDWDMVLSLDTLYSRKRFVPKKINSNTKLLSVTEYAKDHGLTRQAILAQIKDQRLPSGVSAEQIGSTWFLTVKK